MQLYNMQLHKLYNMQLYIYTYTQIVVILTSLNSSLYCKSRAGEIYIYIRWHKIVLVFLDISLKMGTSDRFRNHPLYSFP